MLDFPASPVFGQVFQAPNGYTYVFANGVWGRGGKTAQETNRVVNPAMTLAQENGDTNSGSIAALTYYAADEWRMMWNFATSGRASGARDSTILTPAGSQCLVTGIDLTGTIAAGTYYAFSQKIEGTRVSDFLWGTANAKQIVLRFQFWSSVAGTFSLVVKNSTKNRSYVTSFDVTTINAWKLYTFVIPGDTTGVWTTDNAEGLQFTISMAVGSNFSTSVTGWQDGEKFGLTTNLNALVSGGLFKLGEVGLYLDPDKTGIAPPWQLPDDGIELRKCQRYWYKGYGLRGRIGTTTQVQYCSSIHPVPMRAAPAVAVVTPMTGYDIITNSIISVSAASHASDISYMHTHFNTSGTAMTVQRVGAHITGGAGYMAASARM
jgi:hypothetical protein